MASNRHVILASHIVIQQLTRRTRQIGNFHFPKAPSGWRGSTLADGFSFAVSWRF
jgi:hypothetical protein